MAERVPNGRCRFGRPHRWLTMGKRVHGQEVYVCSMCLLVGGTGRKASDDLGALFEAERITREHFGVAS